MSITVIVYTLPFLDWNAAYPHVDPIIVPTVLRMKIHIVDPTAFSKTRTRIKGAQTKEISHRSVEMRC